MRTGQRLYRYYSGDPHMVRNSGNTGVVAYERARKSAENASSTLRERIELMFERIAYLSGIPADDAQHILLNEPHNFRLRGRR